MLNLYFYILQFLPRIQSCEKSDKDESFKEKAKPTSYVVCFLLCSVIVKILRKLRKLVNIRNACIVYLLNFGTQFSTSSNYLFWQMK